MDSLARTPVETGRQDEVRPRNDEPERCHSPELVNFVRAIACWSARKCVQDLQQRAAAINSFEDSVIRRPDK